MSNVVYILIFALFIVGLFGVIMTKDKLKRLVFLSIMQTAIIMLFIASGYKSGDFIEPFVQSDAATKYVNPIPQVLMLTAIVVGLATSAVGLAMIVKINKYQK